MPAEMQKPLIYPNIPPVFEGRQMNAWCFYPMGKKSGAHANWFKLRTARMHEHGKSGRTFGGRVVQYITGSTGLDDYEWGVTLFGVHTDDLKDVVYTMRFDQASAIYAEFGTFYVGMVTPADQLFTA